MSLKYIIFEVGKAREGVWTAVDASKGRYVN